MSRLCPLSPSASPKKLKLSNGTTGESSLSSLKKQKTLISRITERALSLMKSCNGALILALDNNEDNEESKNKRGRPMSSRNKNPSLVKEERDR